MRLGSLSAEPNGYNRLFELVHALDHVSSTNIVRLVIRLERGDGTMAAAAAAAAGAVAGCGTASGSAAARGGAAARAVKRPRVVAAPHPPGAAPFHEGRLNLYSTFNQL